MRAAAELADQYASGELRTTIMQNIAVVNVPDRHAETVAAGLAAADLPVSGSPFWRGGVACTGTEFCKLAITETKGFLRWLVGQLDERLPGFDEHLKIHVTGCSNSCGQHWIADIGLEGKKVKIDGKMVDAYYFSLGGALGLNASLNRRVGYRCASTEVPDAIERLLRTFGETRQNGENLRQFFGRHSDEELKTILSGA
jgi:sulfite reductase (ferredoxin)